MALLQHLGGATPSPFHNSLESSEQIHNNSHHPQQQHQQQQQQQQQQDQGAEEPLPSRKRRRNPVDYRELYEQMKKEGSLT